MARGRHVVRGGGRKRQSIWIGPADQGAVAVSTGASTIVASFDPDANSLLAPTIVRTRGIVSVSGSFAADLTISGALGVCIVTDEAFAAGAGSIPRPFDDAGWGGWLAWRSFFTVNEFIDGTGFQADANHYFDIDSKAMRKVAPNETVVLMCESQAGALNCAMHLRLLFLLS